MTKKIVDVDASWDGKGSLDEHRHKKFADMKQTGYGNVAKASKTAPAPPEDIKKKKTGGDD